ncbi:MAG: multiple sugar transport system permease protein [Thermoanaerobacteraceae bacterium]|jgi:multiple sugar transport system permease protein|uniref:ABC transporter permease subunit n=1 Tax=Biomaibacter acetigenes TaxID=2316383 RepID=A0A3G2R349_9FIRM|nr:carbohydrate ABC transporter permease [Biomaibacter acetigenes]MDK2878843.1 multiple sugar transport system permease protein [Thermoanaerobacteraceae bacterium]RKL61805.1 carbohydrate ABC transporter permease [Thermoanaerobacteraceae bacterium SP2]AYO29751.1 ABC transporter permease subunit [Biomaibacter acetigenes]MDN5300812.1 multiple sugar transport system permease protein [Thermoanaerobacteraceae bacterium]MDN5311454.1 multiple sugar transport system permease protein [Thermoanaerobacter
MKRKPLDEFFLYFFVFLFALIILAPFYWLVVSAFSSKAELLSVPIHWFPEKIYLGNITKIFQGGLNISGGEVPPFGTAVKNSIIVAGVTTLICITVGSLAAYAFGRMSFFLSNQLFIAIIALRMLPEIVTVVPLYIIMKKLGLNNTLLGLILVYTSFTLPFVIWMMESYFEAIPVELEDAASIDGLSRLGIFFKIIMPLSLPGLITTAIFTLLTAWDEFLFALIMTSTYQAKTLTVAISEFTTRHMIDYGLMMTGGLLSALPPLLVALALQKYIVSGLTSGAIKG